MEEKEFALVKIHTDDNGSNMLTKALSMNKLKACQLKVGMVDFPIEE